MAKHAKSTTRTNVVKIGFVAVGMASATIALSPAVNAATGPSAGPDYTVTVGEWGHSRQAGPSAGAPIVRPSIEMNGNKAPMPTFTCPNVADGTDSFGSKGGFTRVFGGACS